MNTQTQKETGEGNAPRVGQIMTVHGQQCQIVRVHPFGTVDVCGLVSGKSYRVSGLPFINIP